MLSMRASGGGCSSSRLRNGRDPQAGPCADHDAFGIVPHITASPQSRARRQPWDENRRLAQAADADRRPSSVEWLWHKASAPSHASNFQIANKLAQIDDDSKNDQRRYDNPKDRPSTHHHSPSDTALSIKLLCCSRSKSPTSRSTALIASSTAEATGGLSPIAPVSSSPKVCGSQATSRICWQPPRALPPRAAPSLDQDCAAQGKIAGGNLPRQRPLRRDDGDRARRRTALGRIDQDRAS